MMLLEWERPADDFAGAAGFITSEVSITNLLEKGADPDVAIP